MRYRPLALALLLSSMLCACDTLGPMVDKTMSGVKDLFSDSGEKPAQPVPVDSAAPRLTYDQAAVECNQEAQRPGGNSDFRFCMRGKGWAAR